MIEALAAWWRARTARERLVLWLGGVLVLAIFASLGAFEAMSFRKQAAAELAGAQDTARMVERIAAAGGDTHSVAGDGTLRGEAIAAAQASGLSVLTIAPAGPDRLSVSFAPAPSLTVYRWIETISASGAQVTSTVITRAGDGDMVSSQFEVAGRP